VITLSGGLTPRIGVALRMIVQAQTLKSRPTKGREPCRDLRAADVRGAESLPPMTCRTTPPNLAPCSTRSRCRDLR
ncbi:hypothetical protein ACC771_23195, partial [Rhizobium ruizarguesonis]